MNHKKRSICLVGNFLSKSKGTRGISEDLADRLKQDSWKVVVASHYPQRLLRLGDMVWTAWHRRDDYRIAHTDVFSGSAFLWAEVVCGVLRGLEKPYILTLRGGNLPAFAQCWPGRVRRLLTSARAVTTPSLFMQGALSSMRNDIRYLPNALDIGKYHFKLRTNPVPRLCWLRALHEIYNPTLAVKALALLRQDCPMMGLTMIGPDKGDGSLQAVQRLATELDINDNLRIIGPVPKSTVPDYLSKSDIFINTTRYESFGVSVMEAAAMGMCIVSTNVGELPYLWTNEQDILLVPPDDAQAMAAAVRRVLTEPGLAERLSGNARQKAQQFDWSVILPQWEQLFAQVLEQERKT